MNEKSRLSLTARCITIKPGSWLSEVCLWRRFYHQGWAEAATSCELLAIQPDKLQEVLDSKRGLSELAERYGTAVCAAAEDAGECLACDLTNQYDHNLVV